MRLVLEKRAEHSTLMAVLSPVIAIGLTVFVGAIIFVVRGLDPLAALYVYFIEPVTSLWSLEELIVKAAPLVLIGVGLAVCYLANVWNIGAEGQLTAGALVGSIVPVMFHDWQSPLVLPSMLLLGAAGGMAYAAIPAVLKNRFGANEILTSLMLVYVAQLALDWLVRGPLRDPTASLDQTRYIAESAQLPRLFPDTDLRVHIGILIALAAVVFVYWLLFRTTRGYEIRTVGANPNVARYAGMGVARNFVIAMALSGGLAGLAGAVQQLGTNFTLKAIFATGYGFDAIAVALLAKSHPIAIVPAALLWGALRSGASLMQVRSNMSIDLINIVQALVIMFIAADQMIRWLYRIKRQREAEVVFTRGWGR